ncbi:hypothetical protein [Pararhodobacter sp.]|uniref:hypothetical protein n=1 Tax=Pararhodobacter sp. TaxID=2127056 RepID=UPI002AFE1DD6|nr:hypothetical protein [Pararhodobacter sp.]
MITPITHPGPAPSKRWAVATCAAMPIDIILPVAETLAQSVALGLAGFDGGWLVIENADLANLDFVIPGEDTTGTHAAWYAGPYRMGAGRIDHLGLHAGRKDGAAWLHGHGTFSARDWLGPAMGHILPLESRLSKPIRAKGWGLKGARLDVAHDPETNFPLFQPVTTGTKTGAALITLRPNQDMTTAIATAASEAGIRNGRLYGLGSLTCPQLQGQPQIDSHATEILLTEGRLTKGTAEIEVEIVTLNGTLHKGWLEPGANGVCVTAELLVIADL